MRRLFNENRLELIAVAAAFLGVILIGLRGKLGILLKLAYFWLVSALGVLSQVLRTDLPRYLKSIPLSMLIGWLLVLLAVAVGIARARYRFTHAERWQVTDCPRCGSGLQRTRRSPIDRFLTHTLLPSARRYRCENTACRWSGLRRRRHHQDQLQLPLTKVTSLRQ
jgi:hypothetical protein